MLVEDKYFKSDKNYLLKTVQAYAKEYLLEQWTYVAFESYNNHNNPMGLEDDFIIELRAKIIKSTVLLDEVYDILSAIYRFIFSDNQLEFNWDGRPHMEKYDEEWKGKYFEWIHELCMVKDVQRSIIKYAVSTGITNTSLLSQGIKRTILSHFGLRMRSQTIYRISA